MNRRAFPWDKTATWDTALLHDFQRFIAFRKERAALRRGSFAFLTARDDVIAYVRRLDDETVIVVINTASKPHQVELPVATLLAEGTGLDEVWTHATVRVEAGAIRGVALGPRTGRVFATPLRH
jgi:glycosidase